MRKTRAFLIILFGLLLISGVFLLTERAEASSFSAELYDNAPEIGADIGNTVTFTLNIANTSGTKFEFQGTLALSAGLTLQSVGGDAEANGTTLMNSGVASSYTVQIVCTASASGDQTATVSGLASTSGTAIVYENFSASDTVYVRSQAEIDESKQAEADESSRAAYESSVEASRAARESSEAASREAESRSEEESRQASSEAERRSIEAAEESRRQSLEESENEENSKEAARVSSEDAARKSSEEASLEESIRESGIGKQTTETEKTQASSSSERSTAAGIETTEPTGSAETEISYFSATIGRKTFYFASARTETEVPEGLEKTELRIGSKDVLAFRGENYPEELYLVYGNFNSGNRADYYYYDAKRELLFELSMLPAAEAETAEESAETEEPPSVEGELVSTSDLFFLCILSMVLGSGVAVLILLLSRKKRQ